MDYTKETVKASVERSLRRMGVDYLDLVQLHDVEFASSVAQLVDVALPALQELKAAGKCRYVGVTGYNINLLKKIVKLAKPGSVDTIISYARYTLFNKGKEREKR